MTPPRVPPSPTVPLLDRLTLRRPSGSTDARPLGWRPCRPRERAHAAHPHRRRVVRAASRCWPASPRDVLDIGGGTGGLAVRIGELGHRVTVVDPSPDALAALDRRAREHDVAVTGRQGDLSSLLDVVGPDSADLVLCHGVLEVVDDPAAALATLGARAAARRRAQPPGRPAHAAVVARAMAGHFQQALALLDPRPAPDTRSPRARAGRRYTHDELAALVARRRVHRRRGARHPGLHRPGARLAARPRARGHRGAGRAGAGGGRPGRSTSRWPPSSTCSPTARPEPRRRAAR